MGKNKLPYCLFLFLALVFTGIVARGLVTAQPGDENTYYYMGKLVSEGKAPYGSFFYAHPPLHLYLISLIYKIFGFNIAVLKSISLLATLISSFLVFKISKEKFGNNEAVISSLLFLFAYSTMFNSVFSFGVEIAAMFVMVGTYLLFNKNNYYLAGIFFGIGGITRLLSLVPIAVIFIWILFSNRKNFLKLAVSFFIIFLLVNGFFILLYGAKYVNPVYKFHLLKSSGNEDNLKEYFDIIKLNWILFLSAIAFVFAKHKKNLAIFAAASAAYLLLLLTLKKFFGFYLLIIFPFLAIFGGYAVVNVIKNFISNYKWKISIIAILSLLFIWNLASDVMFLHRIGFIGFERGNEISNFVVEKSDKNTMLFGDDSIVPLLALMTGKNIANDAVDTNNEVFKTGMVDLNKALNDLKGKNVLFIIRNKQGISYFSEVKKFLNNECDFLSQFNDKIEGSYLIYKCK